MPILIIGSKSLLVCVNREHPTHIATGQDTTMSADVSQWFALLAANPPNKTGAPAHVALGGLFLPTRPYICQICGYVELYAAGILEPGTFRGESR
ncbi:hypothetical protein [Polyangium spumosum]|uniref:Uncharacterized protein n=1 Tax=Polyangium spumosum TaxID=889282 RepID=A0A6N7PZZ9_9BACT|nr:hypothetical protein [Polyangium spumosum]MRG97127.1 hypothetical protein [Polyangium spumosum]